MLAWRRGDFLFNIIALHKDGVLSKNKAEPM
jgi:hypothetical protein